jgi:predicted Zn-dependent peptidase
MRLIRVVLSVLFLLWCLSASLSAQSLLPDVQEQDLKNGVKVILVERPGKSAVHVRLFMQTGRADTQPLPPVSADLLARCLFGSPLEGEPSNGKELVALLASEEGAFESVRREKLQQTRLASEPSSSEILDLEALHRSIFEKIRGLAEKGQAKDPRDDMNVARRETESSADFLSFGADVPKANLDAYLHFLANRLNAPLLARFPIEREQLLNEMQGREGQNRAALDVILNAALSGQPYAQADSVQRPSLEALTWSAMRAYARTAAAPEHLVLVMVGDVRMQELQPSLEKHFGAIRSAGREADHKDGESFPLSGFPGPRRLQASLSSEKRLFIGWRIPPISHPDHFPLQVLAQMLGGGRTSRLPLKMEGDRHLADDISVKVGVPGGRSTNLLLIEARPAILHDLSELEQITQGELIHLQRGAFLDGEIHRAQRQLEVETLMAQEDSAQLAELLGTALCEGGDWRLAFRPFQIKQDFTPQEIQRVAQKYLGADQCTVVALEPDPIYSPQDPLEKRMVEVLKKILEAKRESPGQAEAVIRETLRQFRMLPPNEKEQALKLLESQVKP